MRTTMQCDLLLEALHANKALHVQEFNEAWEAFLKTVEKETTEFLASVKLDGEAPKDRWSLSWTKPESHEEDYDRAIGMAQRHTAETIELNETDFDHFILDDWDWKNRFVATNSSYTGR